MFDRLSNIVDIAHTNLFYDSHFHRDTIKFLQKYFENKKNLVGVEIGVNTGKHAFCMLYHIPLKKLYLIDPFLDYNEYKNMDRQFIETKNLLKKYENKTEFIRKTSNEAINSIPDNLDFVYIDGNHEYDFVKEDIKLYHKKLKEGGVLCGHDFDADHRGVVKAVCEFSDKNKFKISGLKSEWWIIMDGKL